MMVRLLLVFVLLCASAVAVPADAPVCENEHFRIDANFAGGDLDKCKFTAADSVELTFRPEDHQVDDAFSWFSVRVVADDSQAIKLQLRFPDSYPRFWPKLSSDGVTWTRASEDQVSTSGKNMQLRVTTNVGTLWISAQELLTEDWYEDWRTTLAARKDISSAVIGASVEGRPIHLLKTANKPEAIILLGRQHPVEVPGAIAMRDFVDTVLADTELAREFRDRFTLLIIPLINPDGVANGNSRHNADRTDLNRD